MAAVGQRRSGIAGLRDVRVAGGEDEYHSREMNFTHLRQSSLHIPDTSRRDTAAQRQTTPWLSIAVPIIRTWHAALRGGSSYTLENDVEMHEEPINEQR